MFRSKGKFGNIVCPLSSGSQCTRPYCQFKHASDEKPETIQLSVPNYQTTDSEPKQTAESPTLSEKPSAEHNHKQNSESSSDSSQCSTSTKPPRGHIPTIRVPQYRPTPLAILKQRSQESKLGTFSAPVYVPTPISQLKANEIEADFSSDEHEREEEVLKEIFSTVSDNDLIKKKQTNGDRDNKTTSSETRKTTSSHANDSKHRDKKRRPDSKERSSSSHKSSRHESSSKKHKSEKSAESSDSRKESSKRKESSSKSNGKHKSSSSTSSKSSSHHKSSSKHRNKDKSESLQSSSSSSNHKKPEEKYNVIEILSDDTEPDSADLSSEARTTQPMLEADVVKPICTDIIEFSDDDVEMECLRLFEEGGTDSNEARHEVPEEPERPRSPSKVVDMVGTTRKRVAHDPSLKPAPPVPRKIVRPSPSQQLALRLEAISKLQKSKTETNVPTPIDRKRVVGTVSSELIRAVQQKKLLLASVKSQKPAEPTVYRVALDLPQPHATNHVQTKGISRVAHAPKPVAPTNASSAPPRPRIAYDSKVKVPVNVRQMYLEKLIDANNLICSTYEESYEKSLEIEQDACLRSKDKRVYLSVMANSLFKLKKQTGEIKVNPVKNQGMTHAEILGGPKAKKMSFSIEKNRFRKHPTVDNITEVQFYDHLKAFYLMTSEQLDMMGFPRSHEQAGRAVFRSEKALNAPPDPRSGPERICSRCKKMFQVNEKGLYVRQEMCSYHWGKNWVRKVRQGNTREQQYTCCDAASGSDGCCVAQGHVFENPPLSEDIGYVTTMPSDPSNVLMHKKVYALDCEMIYTTRGTELARISVVDLNMATVYETKVKPGNPVLDYNTRFSGLKMEDLENCRTSIYDVQAVLLSMFSSDTILMGHSLESDLKALKLIHSTVVDTSLVFPHKMGLPYKRALKNLLKEYCQKIIQDGVDGHDSAEDAKACIELMLRKVKEDLRAM